MPLIKGAASDFTQYQKSSAQANSFFTWKYSRVGQVVQAPSITSSQSLATRESLRSSSRTVASLNIRTRGNSTTTGGADQSKSALFPGVPRYFLD
jgi:hypothetical protein